MVPIPKFLVPVTVIAPSTPLILEVANVGEKPVIVTELTVPIIGDDIVILLVPLLVPIIYVSGEMPFPDTNNPTDTFALLTEPLYIRGSNDKVYVPSVAVVTITVAVCAALN